MSTLWHGRFEGDPSEELLAYTVSLPFDQRLAADDIAGSRAHVGGLTRSGLITVEDSAAILEALDDVEAELEEGSFEFQPGDEDIHTAVERRVTELAGPSGAKLHSGRSRNDQIATDLRLFLKRELLEVGRRVIELQRILLERAGAADNAYLPGYTHLQRAQPVLLAHHLMAHAWAFSRDVDRLIEARQRLDVSPLGAGALAGSSLPLDPDSVAEDLGFAARFENSLDAVSDRDFVADSLYTLAMIGVHMSRIGEEFVFWCSEEVGFVTLDDGYSTGSSMLPQKKNPDIAELARGKAGRLVGNLTALLVTLKSLPLAYNRDLQEDKEPVFDSLDQVKLGLSALSGMIATAEFNVEIMAEAADSPYAAAIDLAEYLVSEGIPFRDAHELVAGLVGDALAGNAALVDLVKADPRLGPEAAKLLKPGRPVRNRTSPGGAGPKPVAKQMKRLAGRLDADADRLAGG